MPLTNIQVRNAKLTDKNRKIFDADGLYLLVPTSGNKRWRLKYRFKGKEKCLSLGIYPHVSLKDARKKCSEAHDLLANGIDPSKERKSQKAQELKEVNNNFQAVALEWFERKSSAWTARHCKTVLQRLENNVFPWLGEESITDLSAVKILTVLRRIEERGANETTHRVLGICNQIYHYAIATGRIKHNPCPSLRGALTPVKGKHLAAATEPSKVAQILRALDGYEGSFVVRCALQFAPLVFVRPGELRQALWEDIDLSKAEWRYIVTKTNTEHIVPLCKQAVVILKELKPLTGHGKYVFPSPRNTQGDRPMSDNAVLAAMRSMGIGKEDMSGHGFRATARTLLDEVLGFRPDYIEHQLAHAVRDPNGRAYNRTKHLPQRKVMMQAWADYLDGLKLNP